MAKRLGVSQNTVARALSELADTGLPERRVGHGAVVAFDEATWQVGATDGTPWHALLTALVPGACGMRRRPSGRKGQAADCGRRWGA